MARLEETRPTGNSRARGLVSDRASGARVEAHAYAPPAGLADVVEALWVGRWDLPPEEPHTTRLLGDPCIHLVWEWGDGVGPSERVVGVWTRLWTRRLDGRGTVRGVKLRAGAAAALFDDASALTNRIVPLAQVVRGAPGIAELDPRAEADEASFVRLLEWLSEVRRHLPDTAAAVAAVEVARARRGITQVHQLARAVGLSERSLQRLFRVHVGATPKQVLRRLRLQEAALRLERGDAVSLTDLAFELGYADQAHFSRDWRAAVQTTPSGFARPPLSRPPPCTPGASE